MEVGMLPISASKRGKLLAAGYTSLHSISRASASQLATDIEVSQDEACEILKYASQTSALDPSIGNSNTSNLYGGQTAWTMLNEEKFNTRITTSCVDLDNILGGGITCKEVTELGGVPGIGKTQIGIQLAVNVQIPLEYGGLGGKAIYIDTEGSFMVERVLQIAEACIEDMSEYSHHFHNNVQDCEVKMHPNSILENIFYFRVCSYTEQIALVNYLDKFIEEHKDVKIIIIDSVTFHFRQDFEDMALRTRLLNEMALKLMKLARKFCSAVVLLNQVTTKYIEGSYQLTLALGDSWSHSCTNRIILFWNGDERHAYIDKSPSLKSASAAYSVTTRGIRNSNSSCKRIKMV
ncbi:DNA repair protein RAD51 homolog 3 isoform X1 [Arachis stenosperma]|uniref:DNA repair protein RAD51 homolog 3 isoform X1 n=1 Tax=Arachis stenosperma TaxID=217475 RepID=UPI0025ACF6E6|nr:DNA repair protein RAD51 homolog 3 isoform X1 [Arachis stenosperma]